MRQSKVKFALAAKSVTIALALARLSLKAAWQNAAKGPVQMSIATIDKATIRAVAQLIAQKFDPEQIILFGSHARGNAGSHSDIDLLVVLKSLDDWPKRRQPHSSGDWREIRVAR